MSKVKIFAGAKILLLYLLKLRYDGEMMMKLFKINLQSFLLVSIIFNCNFTTQPNIKKGFPTSNKDQGFSAFDSSNHKK
jgi:hypothetical protein